MSKSKIEKIVYFVRHGESEDNAAPVFQSPNSPLSSLGKEQAELIAERISKLSFNSLISSPYQRAKETAEAIARKTQKEIQFSELFVERIKPTSISGKPYTDEQADLTAREWSKSLYDPTLKVEDSENYQDIMNRAEQAIKLLNGSEDKSMVVVTHGYFLRTILAKVILGSSLTPESFRHFQRVASMENTGLTVLQFVEGFEDEPCWRLSVYNDHAHLAE